MPTPVSIDDLVLQLQTMLDECARRGISAALECDPPVVVGRAAVRVRARIFASAEELATVAPVLRCAGVADVDGCPLKARRGREGEYIVTLPSGSVDADGTYHLTLHPGPDADAIAQCTLHTFSAGVVATARRGLREVLPAQRTGDAAPSPRRGRATRRRRT